MSADFGYLPQLANLQQRSVSAFIWLNATPSASQAITGVISPESGFALFVTSDLKYQWYEKSKTGGTGFTGIWKTPASSVATGVWTNVIVTRDASLLPGGPSIYIDGIPQTLTNDSAGGTELRDESGSHFMIGCLDDYTLSFDGKIARVRVWDRILTAHEISEVAFASDVFDLFSLQDGLRFYGPVVRTDRLSEYIDEVLDENTKVLDAISYAVGTPVNGPTGRTGF